MIEFIQNNWGIIAGALFAISEVLSLNPKIKANGIFQLIAGWLKKTITK